MSVYQLVNSLCCSFLKDSDSDIGDINVQSVKRIAFEALLHESVGSNSITLAKVVEEYNFAIFELLLQGKATKVHDVEAFIQMLLSQPTNFLYAASLLVKLKDVKPIDVKRAKEQHNFLQLKTTNIQDLVRNKYFSQVPLLQQQQQQQPPPSLSNHRSGDKQECGRRTRFLSSILEKNVDMNSIDNRLENLKLNPIECKESKEIVPKNLNVHESTTHESVGSNSITLLDVDEQPPAWFRISAQARLEERSSLVMVSSEKLLHDAKLLLIGIESETFKRVDNMLTFKARETICCSNIANIDQLLEQLLESGTCYKRLKVYTAKNLFNQNQLFNGFMFKTFCHYIVKFLNFSRDIILSQNVESLLQLHNNTDRVRRVVTHLAKFLKIHPSMPGVQSAVVPAGSEFLKLLFDEYANTVNDEVRSFYIELLKSCCEVYYLRYQEWLYHGKLEDPNDELFIYFVGHYTINTKYYFDRAYLIRAQSVPSFLAGCANEVLLCGKYTELLKSHNPAHPLLTMKKPSFKICLTFSEINKLREKCKEFLIMSQLECGEAISIAQVLEESRQRKLIKYKNAEIASVKNMQKWNRLQEEKVEKIRLFRERQQKDLQKELEIIEERKMLKRIEEIQAERDYLDQLENIEKEELEKENAVLKEKIKILQRLDGESEITLEDITLSFPSRHDDLNANKPLVTAASPKVHVDELNNIIIEERTLSALTEAQNNRFKAMSHEHSLFSFNSDSGNGNAAAAAAAKTPLTEAQRNKLKIMGQEYNMIEVRMQQPIVINVQDYDKMSDLEKNRLKILSTEFENVERIASRKEKGESVTRRMGEMTDLQRNRKKVLSHEFGYDTDKSSWIKSKETSYGGTTSASSVELSLHNMLKPEARDQMLESPMSITSDNFTPELTDLEEESAKEHRNSNADEERDEEFKMKQKEFEEAIIAKRPREDDDVSKLDAVTLAHFLQASLTFPLSAYMQVLNNEILKMFIKDMDILTHFKSLRNYFLLMNGEYCSSICHEMFSKIEKGARPAELLNYQSLHMILDQALSRSRFYDVNAENLSFIVQNIPDKFELYSPGVLNMLTLSYQVTWPLSLILNPETMEQYKAIFNYLLKLKRISFSLEQCFQILKESHKLYGSDILMSSQYRHVQYTRHKMTQFVSCLENYVTRNIIQISWSAFIEDLKSAHSIDAIYRKHAHYLKRILFLCLLTKKSQEFYKNVEDTFKCILKFHKHLKSKSWSIAAGSFVHENYEKMSADALDFDRLLRYMIYLGNKIIQHGHQKEMYDLLQIIDINGFYTSVHDN